MIKDRVDDSIVNGMVKQLKSTLALTEKKVTCDTHSKIWLIKPKRNIELGGGYHKK